jgi:hypothetical protein
MTHEPRTGWQTHVEAGTPVAADNIYPYGVGITGGLVAGAVMALAMALWGLLSGNGIWYPVNLIAATFLSDLQAAPAETLAQFHPGGAVVGTLIHFTISAVLGLLFAILLPTLPGSSMFWALIVGPLLWVGAQYAILPAVNPRMDELVHQSTFVLAHLAYSLVLGWWVSRAPKIRLPGAHAPQARPL